VSVREVSLWMEKNRNEILSSLKICFEEEKGINDAKNGREGDESSEELESIFGFATRLVRGRLEVISGACGDVSITRRKFE
jgi:hypothetical protein